MSSPRRKRPAHPPVIFVEWHDSRTLNSGWKDRTRVLDEAPGDYQPIVTAGLLLGETKAYIVLALGLSPGDDVIQTIQIPKAVIVRRLKLRKAHRMTLKESK